MNPGRERLRGIAALAGAAVTPAGLLRARETRRLFHERGYTNVTLKSALRAWIARVHLVPADIDLRQALVVDIGANHGLFSAGVLAVAPQARITAVEPHPAARAQLTERFGPLPNVEILDVAVAATSGTATFHLAIKDELSSLRAVSPERLGDDYWGWAPAGELKVRTVTLDELVGDRTVDVLKVDVQGAERDVLLGGEATLARARSVLLEMTFFPQYEGDATFNDLHAEMARRGFSLVNVSPTHTTPDGTAIFIDACYARPAALNRAHPGAAGMAVEPAPLPI